MNSTTHSAKLVFGDESLNEMYQVRFDDGEDEAALITDTLTQFSERGQSNIKYLWRFPKPQH